MANDAKGLGMFCQAMKFARMRQFMSQTIHRFQETAAENLARLKLIRRTVDPDAVFTSFSRS
jgi:hypothetical protein